MTDDLSLSFPRIVDLPFRDCLAALAKLLHQDGRRRTFEIDLRQGSLSRPLRMELLVNPWSPSQTHLELVPRRKVHASQGYFVACHALLDELQEAMGHMIFSTTVAKDSIEIPLHSGAT